MKKPTLNPASGIALILTLLWVLVLSSLALLLHMRVNLQVRGEVEVERQLYSQVQAENGIEYALTLLPHLDLTELLIGQDGRHEGTPRRQWRNPVPYSAAQQNDPAGLRIEGDDGVPPDPAGRPMFAGRAAPGGGHFFLRFSNNPEEPPDRDLDSVVLVRSLGIAAGRFHNPFSPQFVNSVTLVEARLRQEKTFDLPSPLTCFGDSGSFRWTGNQFTIEGGNRPAVSLVESHGNGLRDDFWASLEPSQMARLSGGSLSPSIQDASTEYEASPIYKPVFRPGFWSHFETHLPGFAEIPGDGLRFLPRGGSLEQDFEGLLVVRGPFRLKGSSRIRGLLIHLGGGQLVLEEQSRVEGGVWVSSIDTGSGSLRVEPLQLSIAGEAALLYSRREVKRALSRIPPTQLGWRILFPEMAQ